jgi:hypothetical protein
MPHLCPKRREAALHTVKGGALKGPGGRVSRVGRVDAERARLGSACPLVGERGQAAVDAAERRLDTVGHRRPCSLDGTAGDATSAAQAHGGRQLLRDGVEVPAGPQAALQPMQSMFRPRGTRRSSGRHAEEASRQWRLDCNKRGIAVMDDALYGVRALNSDRS